MRLYHGPEGVDCWRSVSSPVWYFNGNFGCGQDAAVRYTPVWACIPVTEHADCSMDAHTGGCCDIGGASSCRM